MSRPYFPEYDDPLPREEFERRLALAMDELRGEEGERIRELIDWFMRRYPTPTERIRFAAKRARAAAALRGKARV